MTNELAALAQQVALENGHFCARLAAPQTALRARPGHRVQLRQPQGPTIGPVFVMRADARAGWIEALYATTEPGPKWLCQQPRTTLLEVTLDESQVWTVPEAAATVVVITDAAHLGPAVFLADGLRRSGQARRSLVLLQLAAAPPFRPRPSGIVVNGVPPGIIAAMPLLEDWGLPSRLASHTPRPGCFEGSVCELAEIWLRSLGEDAKSTVVAAAGIPRLDVHELAARTGALVHVLGRETLP